MNIEEGVKLWEEYVSKAFSMDDQYGTDILHLKYEDFLKAPMQYLPIIANLAGLDVGEDRMVELCKGINANRKYAFLNDERLKGIYEHLQTNEWMRKLGYNKIV